MFCSIILSFSISCPHSHTDRLTASKTDTTSAWQHAEISERSLECRRRWQRRRWRVQQTLLTSCRKNSCHVATAAASSVAGCSKKYAPICIYNNNHDDDDDVVAMAMALRRFDDDDVVYFSFMFCARADDSS